ncbi:MAG: hypothetical protein NZ853_00120 [Leptospiraceae bacterium]|nr:hypothetical protein [Leptospiraceae bacterium]MDW7976366.1 hypothetical protein [Leptospiraceae bacterium]
MRKLSFFLLFFFFLSLVFAIPLAYHQIPLFEKGQKRSYEYFLQGVSLFNQNQYETAKFFFLKSLNEKPDFYFARRFLADSYFLSGELENSLQEYEILKEQIPHDEITQNKIHSIEKILLGDIISNDDFHYIFDRVVTASDIRETEWLPINIRADEKFFYVLSYKPGGIYVFDYEGNLVSKTINRINFSIDKPKSLVVNGSFLYVSDMGKDEVLIINKANLNLEKRVSVSYPTSMFFLDGILYVWSQKEKQFYKLLPDGNILQNLSIKNNNVSIENPKFETDGNSIYMLDRFQIQKIDLSGYYLETLEIPYKVKDFFVFNTIMFLLDEEGNVWFSYAPFREWKNFFSILTLPPDGGVEIQDWRFLSSIIFDETYFAISDITGKIYSFKKQRKLTENIIMQILNIEVHDFPNIAVQLLILNPDVNPMPNLENRHFEIYENHKRIYVVNSKNYEIYKNKLNLLMIKDPDFRVPKNFEKLFKQRIMEFFSSFRINDEVYFSIAGDNLKIISNSKYNLEIYDNLLNATIKTKNQPNDVQSLIEGMQWLIPKKGNKGIVYFTNRNLVYESEESYKKLINLSLIHQVPIFVISFERHLEWEEFFKNIQGKYYSFLLDQNYKNIFEALLKSSKTHYLLTYKTPLEYKENLKDIYINVRVKLNYMQYGGVSEGGYTIP